VNLGSSTMGAELAVNSAAPCDACRGASETRWKFAPQAPTRARYESLPAFTLP